MTYVSELRPGDLVALGLGTATFVARTSHPLYTGLQLVIWRLADGSWSHDALSIDQYIGEALSSTAEGRRSRLRDALTSRSSRTRTNDISRSTTSNEVRKEDTTP